MLWGEPGVGLLGEVGIDACCGVNLAWGCGGAGAIRFLVLEFSGLVAVVFPWAVRAHLTGPHA